MQKGVDYVLKLSELLFGVRERDKMLREEHRTKPYAFQALTLKPEIPETPMHGRHIPKPRSGHRIVNYRGNIFSFGGYNPSVADDDEDMKDDPHWATSKPLFKELWCYNPSTRRWKKLSMTAPVPDQLASHTAVAYEDKMLVYGGTGSPFGQSISNTVFVLDFAVRTWSELDTAAERGLADMPRPLYGQAVALHDDKLYVVGGTSGYTYFMDVHVLDLTHRRWQCLYKPSEQEQVNGPTARYRHEICYYEGRIYVLGGGSSFEVQPLETLPAFDLETGTWNSVRTHPDASIPIEESYVEQYPRPRRCHSIEKCGHNVYLFGGFDGDKICSLIWRLDLSSMTWKCWPLVMPKPVYFHSSTITEEGKIYIFGGVTNIEENKRTKKMYSCWVKIPSLRTMCWEALNHYVPDLNCRREEQLIGEGIPRDLIKSLNGLG